MKTAVAVIDIGMTNKKVAIYDECLRPLAIVKRFFAPKIVDGLETHDLDAMEEWFHSALREFSSEYDIKAVSFCTHGATFVCVDGSGRPVLPCVFYTHDPGPSFHERFYAETLSADRLQETTGTAPLAAMINPAKGIFFAKEKYPDEFARAELVLPYPQYWGMRFTGKAGAEGTYIGCHTCLWDWRGGKYSVVAEKLGIKDKLPFPLRNSWETLGTLLPEAAARSGLSPSTVVTMGVHDSNASLLPYLVKEKGMDFVLNSTGTWCVLMHPREEYGFSEDEIGKVVFFNRSVYNKPVKTAIFLGGMEYEVWSGLARRAAEKAAAIGAGRSSGGNGSFPAASPTVPGEALYRDILEKRDEFILPEIVPGSGQFPGSRARAVEGGIGYPAEEIEKGAAAPRFLEDPARAAAVLNISLVLQTVVALGRAGLKPGERIFTEGGFRNNPEYNSLLATVLPGNDVFLTDMDEATSFGAAMTALSALRGTTPEALRDLFGIRMSRSGTMAGLEAFAAYEEKWSGLVRGSASVNRGDTE